MQSPSQLRLLNLRDLRQRNALNASEMLMDQNVEVLVEESSELSK
jgi:hypothetical protein